MLSLSYLNAIAQKEVRDPSQAHAAVPLGALVAPDNVYAPVEVKLPENATEVSKPAQPGNYSIVSTNEVAPMVARRVSVESPHPYWNGMDWWLPVYAPPEANQMCLRFRPIDVEYGFDFVEVYDSTFTLVASYTGYYTYQWTPWRTGNLLWIRLHTDGSYAYWGFSVDRLEWGAPVYAESPHPYTNNYYNEWWVDGTPNDKSEYFTTYFPTIQTEAGFDYVNTYGYDGFWWDQWSGHFTDQWTYWDATWDMKITLTSDDTITDWGFIADYSNENREAFVESPHNYYNSMDQSWYIFGPPEATRMRVHFSLIDVENNWDRVFLYDGYGNEVGYYTGQIPDVWSPWCNGNYMRIRLTSDSTVVRWGFRIDNYEPDLPAKSTVTFLTSPTYTEGSATAGVGISQPCTNCPIANATKGDSVKHGLGWQKETEVIPPEARVKAEMGYALPAYIDWRNKGGVDWTTPIRDQGGCGSCVSFGTIATFEAALKIQSGNPDWNIDLSEQRLFSCGGGKCDYGWWIELALNYLRDYGAPYESCFPYRAWDAPCDGGCADWASKSHRLLNWWWVYPTIGNIEYFLQFGPVVTGFDVYQDFDAYTGGVYRHTWGDYEGGHAVSIVGYDNVGGYWIVKNSWGPYWGENGYFRIAFGECNFEQAVAAVVAPSVATITIGATPDSPQSITASFGTSPVGFSHLQTYDLALRSFTATANPTSDGPPFSHWETIGGVSVSDPYSQTTTLTVLGDGTLRAVYQPGQPPGVVASVRGAIIEAATGSVYFIYADPYRMVSSTAAWQAAFAAYDATASGIIYGLSTNEQKVCYDSDGSVVVARTGSGQPPNYGEVLVSGKSAVVMGGPIPNWVVDYYERTGQTPLKYNNDPANPGFATQAGVTVASLPASTDFTHNDLFVVMVFQDTNGNFVLIIYGLGWKGTFAGGIYFKEVISKSLASYTGNAYVFQWTDAGSMDGVPHASEITEVYD